MKKLQINADWNGPYSWPKMNSDLPSLPNMPGVYLFTVDFDGGCMIYAAGYTGRPLQIRFHEHTRLYMSGIYNVLDIDAMRLGIRKVIWHGFWTKERLPDKEHEYVRRKAEIDNAVRHQLFGFRIFVANIGTQPRLMKRLEAAIMDILYEQPPPFSDILDRGMSLSRRWESESPITVTSSLSERPCSIGPCARRPRGARLLLRQAASKSTVILHGLPRQFEI